MCVLALVLTLGGFTLARRYFVAANLWNQTRAHCSPNMEFAAVGFNEPSLVWEFRRGITNYMQQLTLKEAGAFLQQKGPRILIVPTGSTSELEVLATNYLKFRAAGLDTARFRRTDLTAMVKTGD
jgi:hypothetical protein